MTHDTSTQRPLILVSNDDGISALGVHKLIEWLSPLGDITAVCPDGPQSGQSMAITVNTPLRITSHPEFMGAKMYSVNGTPVDCVKLAMHTVVPRRPDIVVTGINHGSNSAINVLYSGTMGAAMEGCAFGIPSIGFSLTDHSPEADFSPCRHFVTVLTGEVLRNGLPEGICLNVNIPHDKGNPSQMRLARACRGNWNDEYKEYTDPHGRKFYWLTGAYHNDEPEATDTDEWCLAHGIVPVVPVMIDRTAPLADIPGWLRSIS